MVRITSIYRGLWYRIASMKITMVVATSQDGFINHLNEKHASNWTSPEDKKHYAGLLRSCRLQLMGRNTYEAYIDNIKISLQRRRVVFTRHPEIFTAVPDKLEFTNEDFPTALRRLEADGFKHALLLGGGMIFSQFLQASLVDEAYVTVEPIDFGQGIPLLSSRLSMSDFDYLKLDSSEILNQKGTRLLHYLRK